MSVRFIVGSSGQGKTTQIIDEVITRSKEKPEKKYYVIVPEQFSLEMQRKIVEEHPQHGFFNIDILSFYRLAYRVFDECQFQPDDILEDLGVSMILKKILTEHEDEFPFFKKSIKKSGFIDELKSMLMELLCYEVSWEQLQDAAEQLEGHYGLELKCREMGKIFEYFMQEISGRFMVTEQILDVLCNFVTTSRLLQDGIFYFDGFTGFTPVQLRFLKELLLVAEQINISITMPGEMAGFTEKEPEELFYFSKKTENALLKICHEANGCMEDPLILQREVPPRFDGRTELAFLEKNLFRSVRKVYEKPLENIHAISCRNPEMEADYVMHRIEELVRTKGYRYRDFAILTGDTGEYAAAFQRKAALLGIPLFEDTKKKVSYHSGVETIRALFHLTEMDYSYESVFRYLKSGMSGLSDEETDELENYVMSAGIRGYSMWKKPFFRKMNHLDEESVERLQQLRIRFLEETEACFLALRDKTQNVRSKMTVLYDTLCNLDYCGKLEKLADASEEAADYVREKEYRQLFELILALMDKIVGIFGEECLPVRELSEIVDAGLDSLGLGVVPLSMDQVILGDLKRTRLPDIRILFIVGMNEGKIPPSLEDRGIISDEERQILQKCGITLSLQISERSLEDEFYMYLAFTKPREELYFTYAFQGNDGKSLRPSHLFKECGRLFSCWRETRYPEDVKRYYFNAEDSKSFLLEELKRAKTDVGEIIKQKASRLLISYWYQKEELRPTLGILWKQKDARTESCRLSEELTRQLFGRELKGSVTRLEKFAACPFQYYCIFGLELKEREEYKIRPVDLGNLFHNALDNFSKRLKESEYNWKSIPEEVADGWIEAALIESEDANLKDVMESSSRNHYKLQTVSRILKRTIRIIKMHLKNSRMEPDRFELHFGSTDQLAAVHLPLKNGNRMQLEGFIDRVDVLEEEDQVLLRIIDYKSGIQEFDMNDLYNGLQMQLVIYMNVASEIYRNETGKKVVPAGIFYYQLKDPIVKMDVADEEKINKNFRMSGYANSTPDILQKMEDSSNFVSASVRLNKKGEPYKNSSVMDTEDFYRIRDYTRQKIMEMGEEIYAGNLPASPYKNDKRTACEFCSFASVCGFDSKLEGFQYRDIRRQSAKEVLEQIRKQVD